MTEAEKKTAKPKVGKVPAEKPAAVKAEKPKAAKPAPSGKTITLTQIQGTIARKWDQQATLKGLGLGKRHRTRVLQDTPEIRGMVHKVQHLVKVENM